MADGADGEGAPAEGGTGEGGPGPSPQVVAENRQGSNSTPPKEPGWYPVRANPNEQIYWDGTDWTGRRRWSAGTGWTEIGADAVVTTATPAPASPGPRLSANPYAPRPTTTTTRAAPSAPGFTLGVFFLLASGVAMMVGSVTTWISSNASFGGVSLFRGAACTGLSVSTAVSGVADGVSSLIGINGYITLIAAAVVLLCAGLMAVSDDGSVRLLGCLFALVCLGLSIYAVVRLAQKLDQVHTHGVSLNVGWGLILTLAAAVVATLLSLFEVTRNR